MLGINLKHSIAAVAVAAGLITYNGHAGLGASVTDGTSNTIMFVASDGVGAALVLMADPGGQFR